MAPSDPNHIHSWMPEMVLSNGKYARRCRTCDVVKTRDNHSFYADAPVFGTPESLVAPKPETEMVSATSMGGFVAFDLASGRVQMRDGGEIEVESLAGANKINTQDMIGRLLDMPLAPRFFTPQQLAGMQEAVSGNPQLGAGVDAEGALVLIIETVRNAGSPDQVRAEGRKWLTKITTQITAILAELDE